MNYKISVIVPIYNTEKYLNRCIDSILAQSYSNFEIILIDDGSTDSSSIICDRYAEKDNRVKAFHKENGGVSRARNMGIDNATGDYVHFMDSDDYIRPNMYEKLVNVLKQFHVDVVCSNIEQNGKILNNKTPSYKKIGKQEIHDKVLPFFTMDNTLGAGAYTTMLIKRSVLIEKNVRFYEDFAFQEDTMFVINLYANIDSLYYLPEVFYEYITNPTGLYSAYRKNDGANFVKAKAIMRCLIDKYDIPIDELNFNIGYLYNISWFIYRSLRINDKKEQKKIINEVIGAEETFNACLFLSSKACSFDKRIAKAVCRKKYRKAIRLIKFVYSGKAARLQRVLAKLKGNK